MSYLVGPSQDQRTRTVSSLFVYVFFFSFSILLLVADADDARQTASGYLLTRWTRLHDNQQAIRTDRAEFHLQRVREIDEQVFLLLLLLYYDGQKETAGGQSSLQSYNRFPFSFFFFFFFLIVVPRDNVPLWLGEGPLTLDVSQQHQIRVEGIESMHFRRSLTIDASI